MTRQSYVRLRAAFKRKDAPPTQYVDFRLEGRAIDVRLSGCETARLRAAALAARRGGVGFYPQSDFVHLDTGRFRTWGPRAA
jgi:Bacterial protein of unknown function (DUF882)